MTDTFGTPSRRGFLGLALGAGAFGLAGAGKAAPRQVKTNANILILGAGAAGAALANRLIERLDGATITLVDRRREHWYQPGFSLIAAGLKPASYSVSQTTDWLPSDVTLKQDWAANIDPEARKVALAGGEVLSYDYLIVATGLSLDHDAIDGFSLEMVSQDGIGALYAGPDYAAKTWQAASKFTEDGGVGLFTRPATEMKCAGAPLKHIFLIDDLARKAGSRGKTAASVKWQVPVVEEHLVAQIAGDTTDAAYNGYTSCPLITQVGRAMLVEFDYNNNLTPSFPGIIAPLEELWISWLMKEVALKATYNAMLRGKA